MRRNKYNNKITRYDGKKYHSKLEANYAAYLDLLLAGGKISAWTSQLKIPIYEERYLFSICTNITQLVTKGNIVKVPVIICVDFSNNGIELSDNAKFHTGDKIIKDGDITYELRRKVLVPEIIDVYEVKTVMTYIADFLVEFDNGSRIIIDTKSSAVMKNPVFNLKKRLIESRYRGIKIEVMSKVPKINGG